MNPRNRPSESGKSGSFLNIFRGRTPLILATLLMSAACKGEATNNDAVEGEANKIDVVQKAVQSILNERGEANRSYWPAAIPNCHYPPQWDPDADVAIHFIMGDMIVSACSKALGNDHNSESNMQKCLRAVTTREALCSQLPKKSK